MGGWIFLFAIGTALPELYKDYIKMSSYGDWA
jgi:hypothetical protein